MKRFLAMFTLLCAACLAGCSAPRAIDSAQLGAAPVDPAAAAAEYQLSAGDKVRIIVYNEPTLSNEFTIGSDGMLSFPLIGSINAAGRTTSQLNDEMTQRLGAGYLKSPRLSVEVLTFRPFYILGEVQKAGQYPYAPGMTVLNAVATAGGFSYRAERRIVFIRRSGSAKELPVKIAPDLMVAPGDTIRIGERYF